MFRSDGIFARFMNLLSDVICTGLLWIVFSLPLVTAGAAATAAYYTMAKCVRHKTGYIGREFWHCLRANLRQSLPLTAGCLAAALILVVDIGYVWNYDSTLNSALFVVFVFLVFCLGGLSVYLWPLLSRFDKKNPALLKLAALLVFRYLPVTLGVLLTAALAVVGIWLMPWAVLVIPGAFLYLVSLPMEKILRRLMPAVEEDSEEAQKWYYQ